MSVDITRYSVERCGSESCGAYRDKVGDFVEYYDYLAAETRAANAKARVKELEEDTKLLRAKLESWSDWQLEQIKG